MDSIGLRPIDAINMIILLLLLWILVRIVSNDKNLIIWADYVSTRGQDGNQHGDINKIGQLAGIVLAVVVVLMYADNTMVEPVGLSALLGVSLVFLGAPTMYAGFIRSKQGGVESTRITEMAPSSRVTETLSQSAPIDKGNSNGSHN
jgi:hypothetical protein